MKDNEAILLLKFHALGLLCMSAWHLLWIFLLWSCGSSVNVNALISSDAVIFIAALVGYGAAKDFKRIEEEK